MLWKSLFMPGNLLSQSPGIPASLRLRTIPNPRNLPGRPAPFFWRTPDDKRLDTTKKALSAYPCGQSLLFPGCPDPVPPEQQPVQDLFVADFTEIPFYEDLSAETKILNLTRQAV